MASPGTVTRAIRRNVALLTRVWPRTCWDVPHAVIQPGPVCANAGQDAKATAIANLAVRSRGKPLRGCLLPHRLGSLIRRVWVGMAAFALRRVIVADRVH